MGNFLKLTALEEAIMLAILDIPRYGQNIVEVVSDASDGNYQIDPGTLYPALHRLGSRGLIKEKKVQVGNDCRSLKIRRGHNRRYYQVTPDGREILEEIERIRFQIRSQQTT
ncbi:MAG: PadR family transcriptional regulator [Synechococcales bacterium]|nr:PadR family transcriptional regulator [Synechococcales bacterium]